MGFKIVPSDNSAQEWLVLVHGISQDHRIFGSHLDALRPQFSLLLVDLPGHGLSSELPGPFGIGEFANSIETAMAEAGIDAALLWGTHLGASAALILALRRPSLFKALALEAPVFPSRTTGRLAEILSSVQKTARLAGMAEARTLWWEGSPWFNVMRANADKCRAHEHRQIIEDFKGAPWLSELLSGSLEPIDEKLAAFEAPILIMNGEHDMQEFFSFSAQLAGLLPNCHTVTIPQAGGFPLWEFPDATRATVCRFFAESR